MIRDTDTKDMRGSPGSPDGQSSEWKARLTRMKKYAEKNQKHWGRNKKLLFGKSEDDNEVAPNEVAYGWGLVKSLETGIYVQNPETMVEPYNGMNMEIGRLLTNIANYDIDQMNLKAIGNLGLIDNFVNGFFACIETIETDKETVEEDKKQEVRVTDQRYAAYRIAPKDFLVDPQWKGLVDLSAARFIAIATYPIIADMKANKEVYSKLPPDIDNYPEAFPDKRQAGKTETNTDGTRNANQGETDPEYKTICVWECHDKIKQKVIYVTDHKSQEIGEIDWKVKYRIGHRSLFPVTLMAFHPMADGWPTPEIDLIANQLKKLNELDRVIYQDALTKWRKFVSLVGLLSPDQNAKVTDFSASNAILQVDMDGVREIAELAGTGSHNMVNIRDMITALPDPQVKQDMLAVREMCIKEITDILGYGPPDRGGIPKTRTAREAIAVKDKLEARLAKRSDAIGDFYRDFGQKHLMALQQTMLVERYTKVFPQASVLPALYQKYAAEDIKDALFNFIVYAGTSAPRSTEQKRSQEMQLFQTLMPMVSAGMIPPEPVILRLAEAVQWKGVDALLRNYKPAMKQLAAVLVQLQSGKVPPNALPEAAAAAVQAALTPEELKMLATQLAGESSAAGSAPAKKPPGERGESDASRAQYQ